MATKEEKRNARTMLCKITSDLGWENDPMAVKQANELAKFLDADNMGESRPLPSLDYSRFTPDNYLYLRYLGYEQTSIREALGIPRHILNNWVQRNEVSRASVTPEDLNEWEFDEKSRQLPIVKDDKEDAEPDTDRQRLTEGWNVETMEFTENLLNDYLLFNRRWSEATKQIYRKYLITFFELTGSDDIYKVNPENYCKAQDTLKKSVSPGSFRDHMRVVTRFMKWAGFSLIEFNVVDPPTNDEVGQNSNDSDSDEVVLSSVSKKVIMIGEGFAWYRLVGGGVALTKDIDSAMDADSTKGKAVIESFGGKKVVIEVRKILKK
ncbi:hypothetical protein [Enterococcus sp. DIV0800]|uniref:hypothetical protein n=1 Tax=unclassified Enterococcus TaxID=2608891 RepID=UPI003D2FE6FF